VESIPQLLDFLGVAVFAVSAALAAGRKRMDLFGVFVLATVTAIGGGTLRDLVLDVGPVFWVTDPTYLLICAGAVALAFVGRAALARPRRLLEIADAAGLAVFSVLGTGSSLAAGFHPLVCLLMGVITAVAGGMLRDVIAGDVPLILRSELYATAALVGSATFYGITLLGVAEGNAALVAVGLAFATRCAAIRWGLSLPAFGLAEDDDPGE